MIGIDRTVAFRFHRPLKSVELAIRQPPARRAIESAASPPGKAPAPLLNGDDPAGKLDMLLNQLLERLDALETSRNDSFNVIHQIAVELSMVVAGRLLFQQIDEDTFPVREMVNQLMAGIESSAPVRVYLNPADLAALQQRAGQDGESAIFDERIQWLPAPELKRGSTRMDANRYSLFYDGVLQLNELRQNLLEVLGDAEIERRKTDGNGSRLRRFPDRRASG